MFDVKDATEAGATALAAANAGNVLKLGSSENGAGKYFGYTAALAPTADGCTEYSGVVDLSFKLEPMQVRKDGKPASIILQFADVSKTPILPITIGTGANEGLTVNGDVVAVKYGTYCVVTEKLDFDNKKASITITDAAGTELYKKEDIALTATNLAYLHLDNKDWNYGYCAVDDIQLDATQIGAPVYYTATINTTRYAKMTTSDNKTYYADVNGKLEIPLIKPNTTFDYTLSKVGYNNATGTVTVVDSDFTDDKTLTQSDEDVIFIESEFGNANEAYVSAGGSRNDSISLGSVDLPRMSEIAVNFNFAGFGGQAGQQKTWCLDTDGGRIVGIQISDNGLYAWTDWTGDDSQNKVMNQSDDIGAYAHGIRLGDVPSGEFNVKFVVNTEGKAITVSYGDISGSLTYDITATKLTGMSTGLYRYNGELRTNEIKITEPDPMYMAIIGTADFAKISGKTVTQTYGKTESVITKDETFTWTVERPNKTTKKGAKFTLASAPAEDMKAIAIIGAYNSSGILKSLRTEEVTIKAGQTEVLVEESADNAKVMLWKSLESMEPLAPVGSIEEYEVIIEEAPGLDGISIDPTTGVLSVTDEAVPGPVKVTCTGSTGKTASMDVVIRDFANVTAVADGPNAYEVGQKGQYEVTSLVDQYGANVISMFAPKFTSDNTEVITVDAETGEATAVAPGSANITVTVGNPDKEAKIVIPVTVASYYVTTDATGDSTEISLATIKDSAAITGYQVTTATADGALVKSSVVAKADVTDNKITADTTGANKVEVAPVYETNMNTKVPVPADRYNVTVTASNGARTDVYVNNQMMFNNINQGSDNWTIGRVIAASTEYTANDVVIAQGYANFNYRDDKSGGTTITKVKFVKSPSIVTRSKRVYVIGDSLVANYYGVAPEGKEGYVRTGWGQVLQNYISGAEVTNLGNSGAWATGMRSDAFTNVLGSAQPGDIMILESGYNDRSHSTDAEMREAVKDMLNKANEMGLTTFLVTPNASAHDYNGSVVWSAAIREVAAEVEDTTLIDLAKYSYEFLNSKYGTLTDAERSEIIVGTTDKPGIYNNSGDTLHSSYNAANCWAAVVAQAMNEAGVTVVNTDYKYEFSDGTNTITAQAGLMYTAASEDNSESSAE